MRQEASVVRPLPGSEGDTTSGGGGGGGNAGGSEAQQQQRQQQSKHGSGREDGSAPARASPGAGVGGKDGGGGARPGEGLLESMDVFSLGCVIAEVGWMSMGAGGRGYSEECMPFVSDS